MSQPARKVSGKIVITYSGISRGSPNGKTFLEEVAIEPIITVLTQVLKSRYKTLKLDVQQLPLDNKTK